MCSGKLIGYLGLSRRGVFIGEGASSEVDQGALTHRALRLLFGSLEASGKKIRLQELVSSNSKNISCVPFLKHKNSRKQGTGTVATC
jgi:hypothetical protein